jgi:uncharacterized SAM-binding protein YcdF (DUF218 family)
MFFVLSKVLRALIDPLMWVLALLLVGLVARNRRPRLATATLAGGAALLLVASLPLVGHALLRTLEMPVRTTIRDGVVYDVVVVLSGVINDDPTLISGEPQYNESVDRLLVAYTLHKQGRARNLLLSGGSGQLGGGAPEADVLARQLEAWGVGAGHVYRDSKSRNTHENAVESARIIAENGWKRVLLVTSAFHMPRAIGCFHAVGLGDIDTLAVDIRTVPPRLSAGQLSPAIEALGWTSLAIHEWVGRVAYRLRGFSAP